jgi:hypothetical protein
MFPPVNLSIYDAGPSGEDTLYNMGILTPVFFAKAIASG